MTTAEKKYGFPIFLSFFLAGVLFPLTGQSLYIAESGVWQGGVVTAFVYPCKTGVTADFVLKGEDGTVITSSPGWILDLGDNGFAIAALLGVSSSAADGIAVLEADVTVPEGETLYFSKYIKIAEQVFLRETIPLSKDASDLVQVYDPRKTEQSRTLWEILSSVDTSAVFFEDNFSIPVIDSIESAWYGDRRLYRYDDGTSSSSIHGGLDLAADTGIPVAAAGSGMVVMAEERVITGWTVVIEHLPGVYSLYYHMDSLNVEKGQMVEKNQLIGTVGATGLVTGAHLHWELKIRTVSVDPKPFLTQPLIDKDLILDTIYNRSFAGTMNE